MEVVQVQWFFVLPDGGDTFKVSARLIIERSKDTCEGTRQFLEGMTRSVELLTVKPRLLSIKTGGGMFFQRVFQCALCCCQGSNRRLEATCASLEKEAQLAQRQLEQCLKKEEDMEEDYFIKVRSCQNWHCLLLCFVYKYDRFDMTSQVRGSSLLQCSTRKRKSCGSWSRDCMKTTLPKMVLRLT